MEIPNESEIDWNSVLIWSIYIFLVVLIISGVLIIFTTVLYCISLDYQLRKTRRRVFIKEVNERIRDYKKQGMEFVSKDNKVAEVVAHCERFDDSSESHSIPLPMSTPKDFEGLEPQRSP